MANAGAQCTHVPFLPFQPVRIIDSRHAEHRRVSRSFPSLILSLCVSLCSSSSSRTRWRPSFHRILRVFEALPTGTYVSRLIGLPMRSPSVHAFATRSHVPRKRKCARSFPPLALLSLSLSLSLFPFVFQQLHTSCLCPPCRPLADTTALPSHRYRLLRLSKDTNELSARTNEECESYRGEC